MKLTWTIGSRVLLRMHSKTGNDSGVNIPLPVFLWCWCVSVRTWWPLRPTDSVSRHGGVRVTWCHPHPLMLPHRRETCSCRCAGHRVMMSFPRWVWPSLLCRCRTRSSFPGLSPPEKSERWLISSELTVRWRGGRTELTQRMGFWHVITKNLLIKWIRLISECFVRTRWWKLLPLFSSAPQLFLHTKRI